MILNVNVPEPDKAKGCFENQYKILYFPTEDKYSIWNGNKLVKEWFNDVSQAEIWLSENLTNEELFLMQVVWNRSFDWSDQVIVGGFEKAKSIARNYLYSNDDRVKNVRVLNYITDEVLYEALFLAEINSPT